MRSEKRWILVILLFVSAPVSRALETVTVEPDSSDYHFVSHYRIQIEAPVPHVWQKMIDLKSWMYEFEMLPVDGKPLHVGQVYTLYQGQDFKMQVSALKPHHFLSVVNLPMSFGGEYGTGLGVFTLHQLPSGTEVALTMSRRYSPESQDRSLFVRRQSDDFQAQTRAMWQDRFLARLKELSEERS